MCSTGLPPSTGWPSARQRSMPPERLARSANPASRRIPSPAPSGCPTGTPRPSAGPLPARRRARPMRRAGSGSRRGYGRAARKILRARARRGSAPRGDAPRARAGRSPRSRQSCSATAPNAARGDVEFALGLAAFEVGRHRDIELFRVRQVQIVHVAGEIGFAGLAAEARVEMPLLADAGRGQPAIIMRRIEQTIVGQGEDLLMHRAVHRARIALLEIGPAAAADQQAIAGEGHAPVVEHIGQAAAGMARRLAHLQIAPAKGDHVVGHQIAVGPRGAAVGRQPMLHPVCCFKSQAPVT